MCVPEAHRALELLEDYHSKLIKPQDKQLRLAIERVIRIFKSRLFQALLGQCLTEIVFWTILIDTELRNTHECNFLINCLHHFKTSFQKV